MVVRQLLIRIFPALQLARVSTAFAAVANVWFVILWTNACDAEPKPPTFREFPLWVLLLGGAASALGLFGFATALNDVLDRRRDQALHPTRPIPSGRVSLDSAVSLVVITLGLAVLGATVLGTPGVLLTLLVAGAILFFNAAGKFVPAVGLIVLGLIYAGQAVIPNLHLRFILPVWLIMTHALLVGAAVHVLGRRTPGLSPRAVLFAIVGWGFWSIVMFAFAWYRNRGAGGIYPDFVAPTAILWPLGLSALFVLLVWRRLAVLGRGPRVAEKIARYGALWLALYAAGWMFGQGYLTPGLILALLAACGLIGMTLLRELFALIEQPLGYRR